MDHNGNTFGDRAFTCASCNGDMCMKTAEQAYEEYQKWIRIDKERFCLDLEKVLKSVGMWNVDVIRKHDGTIGRFKVVIPKTPWKDPGIQFFKYNQFGELGKLHSGNIPYKDTEAYLNDVFRIWMPRR